MNGIERLTCATEFPYYQKMDYEGDDAKAAANLAKHGVDCEIASNLGP